MQFSTNSSHESLFGEAVLNCCGDVGVEIGRCHGVLAIKVVWSEPALFDLGCSCQTKTELFLAPSVERLSSVVCAFIAP